MKLRDIYYNQSGFINTRYTKNTWLKCKDRFWRWTTNAYLQRVYGIEINPKRRHIRSWLVRKSFALFGSLCYNRAFSYTRYPRIIGRKKHGKWLGLPKRGRSEI